MKDKKFKTIAYDKIKNMILLSELQQGEKIFESDIAKGLEISRTPVREALLSLEQERLVENKDRQGFLVRRLNYNEIKDYYELREVMELYAVPLIIANITDEDMALLQDNITHAEHYYAENNTRDFILRSSEFHDLLSKTTRSEIYNRVISSLNDISIFLRAIASKNPVGAAESISGHREILEVLIEKNTDKLRKVLVAHLRDSKNRNQAFIDMIS